MQNAETVLDVLRERGRRGLPLERLYRQLFNPHLYLLAYGRIYSNKGAMTPGVCGETADGMSTTKIGRIINALRHERYRFQPVRRVYIPKTNGKRRPLGLPSWSDKLVGEVVRLLLEAYYEPQFSDDSHGFRPRRGCHTALRKIADTWTGTTWFIEGDIADCFGTLDQNLMVDILAEKIHDNRFLRLVRNMLHAGYLEDWEWNATLSGVPQGGVVSPILSNIYLDRLDDLVERRLLRMHNRGATRRKNPAYREIELAIDRLRRGPARYTTDDLPARLRTLRRQLWDQPSGDPQDPHYRRLRYVRYADDILLGFAGPKHEAESIKQRLTQILRDDLRLELSKDKTLITHARTGAARFLGYEITVQHANRKITRGTSIQRSANGRIRLRVPVSVIKTKCAPYLKRGKPAPLDLLRDRTDYDIIGLFGAQYRGIVQYYQLAGDVWRLDRLRWVMQTSMLKTLAAKHGSTVKKMATKHKTTIPTPHGPRRCYETRVHRAGRKPLVARFGGIPLKRQRKAAITDRPADPIIPRRQGSELLARMAQGRCELCDKRTNVQVHQIRKLADLTTSGRPHTAWMELMRRMRRKTLIVCTPCHETIHTE
ncbi:MAG TPA: reverse transcriptase domain-containing protein [Streptosporangiaceae bacterium]